MREIFDSSSIVAAFHEELLGNFPGDFSSLLVRDTWTVEDCIDICIDLRGEHTRVRFECFKGAVLRWGVLGKAKRNPYARAG